MLVQVVLLAFLQFLSISASLLNESHTTIGPITENEESTFQIWLQSNQYDEPIQDEVQINVNSLTPDIIEVINITAPLNFTSEDLRYGTNLSVSVRGLVFGHGRISIVLSTNVSNSSSSGEDNMSAIIKIRVVRRQRVIDVVFLACITIIVIINNVNMGCILDLHVVKDVLKRPVGPLVGFCSQFLFMPLASYGFSMALLSSSNEQLGLFTLGCCPGGAPSNFWTFLFRGDVNLSVVMTFVSTVAALAMMPIWLFTLGEKFFDDIKIPYDTLFISLFSFVVPIAIGIAIRHWMPKLAKISEKIVRPYTIIVVIFFLTIGIYSNLYLFRIMTWQIVVAGLCVAWGGYVFGALAAWMFCMKIEQIIAISIETALQNPGIAFVLLKVSLPQPDADLASVSPVAQLFVTGVPLVVGYIVYCIYRRRALKKGGNGLPQSPLLNNGNTKGHSRPRSDTNSSELWISVPIPNEDDEEMITIRSFDAGDAGEDVVWQRN